jgi:hypothetical protein
VYSNTSIEVKTNSPDLADFANTWVLIQIYPLGYCALKAVICQWRKTIAQTAKAAENGPQTCAQKTRW